MRNLFAIIILLAGVAVGLPARAQFLCRIIGGANIGKGEAYYWYTALSCNGNNVVVAASVDSGGYYLAFLFSADGGRSWRIQNEGSPDSTWSHQPIIRKIDQIDSLNIIAFGDSGLLVRTTDAGVTWHSQKSPTKFPIEDISFSNSMNGILVAADTVHGTYITTDGGVIWNPALFTRSYGWQCHDYGNGMYRIFVNGSGETYTTMDGWNTFDSTGPIISDISLRHHFVYSNCSFESGDMMLAYGGHYDSHIYPYPCIARTTDAGKHWTSVYEDTSLWWHLGYVQSLSDINEDTIIAGLNSSLDYVLQSTNHGVTWGFDSLISADSSFVVGETFGIGYSSEGNMLGAFSLQNAEVPELVIGSYAAARVVPPNSGYPSVQSRTEAYERILAQTHIFPNPTKAIVHVTSVDAGHEVSFVDILGRVVMKGIIPEDGSLTLNVPNLSNGIYLVMLNHFGNMLPVGKLAIESQ